MTEDGTRWAVVSQATDEPLLLLTLDAETQVATLETGTQDRGYGVLATPFGDGLAIVSVACEDPACNGYAVNVDIGRLDGSDVVVDRRWHVSGGAEAGAPSLVGLSSSTLAVAVGGEVLLFEDGRSEVERVPLPGDTGDPCLVGDALVGVAPGAVVVPDGEAGAPTTLAGPEIIELVDLRTGSALGRSQMAYDAIAVAPHCVAGHLVISPDGQPATFEWARDGWRELPAAPTIEWSIGPRADALGLVGVVGSRAVRVDVLTGRVVAEIAPSPADQGRWEAGPQPLGSPDGGPLGDLIAIGSSEGDGAIMCHQRMSGEQLEAVCA